MQHGSEAWIQEEGKIPVAVRWTKDDHPKCGLREILAGQMGFLSEEKRRKFPESSSSQVSYSIGHYILTNLSSAAVFTFSSDCK
jgi:hypothetical protein